MKTKATTETEMRDEKVLWPKTAKELTEYIESLSKVPQDYGTAVYVMSMAATAAFYYASHLVGATGFQASCADLDFIKRTRSLEGPFALLDYSKLLYPQHVDEFTATISQSTANWLQEEAKKRLAGTDSAHPDVIAYWKLLVAGVYPYPVEDSS